MTRSIRLPTLGRIAWIAGALVACAVMWPFAWDSYRASRIVTAAQEELAWGRLEAGRQRLERASEVTPGDAGLLLKLAGVDASIARLRGDEAAQGRALEALRTAIQLNPLDAGLHAAFGSTHLAFGSLEAAATAFDRALELDPHNRVYLASLARVREEQGRLEDAATLYRRAISVQGSDELARRLERVEQP